MTAFPAIAFRLCSAAFALSVGSALVPTRVMTARGFSPVGSSPSNAASIAVFGSGAAVNLNGGAAVNRNASCASVSSGVANRLTLIERTTASTSLRLIDWPAPIVNVTSTAFESPPPNTVMYFWNSLPFFTCWPIASGTDPLSRLTGSIREKRTPSLA